MNLSSRDFVDLLCKLRISPNQFLICMLVHEKDVAATIKYYEENNLNRFSSKDVQELVSRGFLIRITKDEHYYNLDQFIVTDMFAGEFLIDNDEAGEELWNAYPNWMTFNNTKKTSAKSCDKDDLIEKYGKKIKSSKKRHQDVMSILKQYVEATNGNPAMGIEKFVSSEHWTALKELYNEQGSTDLIRTL